MPKYRETALSKIVASASQDGDLGSAAPPKRAVNGRPAYPLGETPRRASNTSKVDPATDLGETFGEGLEVKRRSVFSGRKWKILGVVFTVLVLAGAGGYIGYTAGVLDDLTEGAPGDALEAGSGSPLAEEKLVKLGFSVLLNRNQKEGAPLDVAAIEQAVAGLRGNIEESLDSFVLRSNETKVVYFAHFLNATTTGNAGAGAGGEACACA